MKLSMLICLAATAASLSACATITRGTHEVLVIDTMPTQAHVALSDGETCETPCSIKLSRKHGMHVSISKAGYQTVETDVNAEIAGGGAAGMAGNVLVGGIIGGAVDAESGAMNKFVPNPLSVTLQPLATGEKAATPVVADGESFYFERYQKDHVKLPFTGKERRALVKKQRAEEKKQKALAKKQEKEKKEAASAR